jgi:hypothetical protein
MACVLEYAYILYGRPRVVEMEQMRARRNYTPIFVAVEAKRYIRSRGR